MKKNLLQPSLLFLFSILSFSTVYSQCDSLVGPAIIPSLPLEFCLDDGLQIGLSGGTPTGGIYSGPGVSDDGNGETFRFNPAQAGVGIHPLSYTLGSDQWTQVGERFLGTSGFGEFSIDASVLDGLGRAISLSSDGNTLALGTGLKSYSTSEQGFDIFEGGVEIFEWNGSNWSPKGQALIGEDSIITRFGSDVSLSADGNRIAVRVARLGVSVYEWNGLEWGRLGQDIDIAYSDETFRFGAPAQIEISSDGQRLMIGNPDASFNVEKSGAILVYDWNGSQWIQAGSPISGEIENEAVGGINSMSGDGKIIAMGVTYPADRAFLSSESRQGNEPRYRFMGEIRTYEWDGANWVKRGQTLRGIEENDQLGRAVTLSEDGSRMAVSSLKKNLDGSSPGKVSIYEWDGSLWQLLGSELEGISDGDQFGYSLAFDGSGSRLAVGSIYNNINGVEGVPNIAAGLVQVFDWVNGEWAQVADNILGEVNCFCDEETEFGGDDGGLGYRIAISADGSTVAGGSGGFSDAFAGRLGYVEVYALSSNSNACTAETEIIVEDCDGCEKVNMALGKPTQTPCDYGFTSADLGVDGITEGNNPWGSPDIVHTCTSYPNPWWQVDLQEEVPISEICVYNRNSSQSHILDRLSNYYLFVSSTPFGEEVSLHQLLNDDEVYHTFIAETAGMPTCTNIPNLSGRYVRIQLSDNKVLNFAELEVLACKEPSCSSPSNLALKKAASQSSTYGFGAASIAVNGDTDGSRGPWANASIQHTQREAQPWWQVDLGKLASIREVVLYNRTDCCQERLQDYYVFVSPNPINGELTVDELLDDPSLSYQYFPGIAGSEEVLDFDKQMGQYVMVKLANEGILHLAEVEVMGCFEERSNGSFRLGDTETNPREELSLYTVEVYPNPFTADFTLELQGELQEGASIEILNTLGQVVERHGLSRKISKITTRDLPQGIYVVQVRNGDRMHEVKVIKMR